MRANTTLPRVIFVAGGDAVARTRLANSLADLRTEVLALSFDEPIRGGCLGTFFACDPSVDVANPTARLPLPNMSIEVYLTLYRAFMRARFGDAVLGQLMAVRLEENRDYFDCFVFDDAIHKPDLEAIVKLCHEDSCLYISLDGVDTMPYRCPKGVRSLTVAPTMALETVLDLITTILAPKPATPHSEGTAAS